MALRATDVHTTQKADNYVLRQTANEATLDQPTDAVQFAALASVGCGIRLPADCLITGNVYFVKEDAPNFETNIARSTLG